MMLFKKSVRNKLIILHVINFQKFRLFLLFQAKTFRYFHCKKIVEQENDTLEVSEITIA